MFSGTGHLALEVAMMTTMFRRFRCIVSFSIVSFLAIADRYLKTFSTLQFYHHIPVHSVCRP
ncbi:hypothetical protein M3J09_008481 [Ascochyta lentis]